MKLQHKRGKGILSEYICELTDELDELAKLDFLYHYIIIDDLSVKERALPVRVYGGTVGSIFFDEKQIVTKIVIDTNYVVKTYPKNINNLVQKYVGSKIEW